MNKALFIVVWLFVFLFLPSVVFASVVINEFSVKPSNGQWVELYNTEDDPVDISGWFIDDSGGTEKFIIPQGTSIFGKSYLVFSSSQFNLNTTTSDTARLLQGEDVVDSYMYSGGSEESLVYGRETDGGSNWVQFTASTKGSSNNASTILPSVTPTIPPFTPTEKVPTPTRTPTLPKTPTPTRTPTPIKSPTPSRTPTQKASSPTGIVLAASGKYEVGTVSGRVVPTAVLGISDENPSQSPHPKPTPVLSDKKGASLVSTISVTLISMLLLGCGILIYLKYERRAGM